MAPVRVSIHLQGVWHPVQGSRQDMVGWSFFAIYNDGSERRLFGVEKGTELPVHRSAAYDLVHTYEEDVPAELLANVNHYQFRARPRENVNWCSQVGTFQLFLDGQPIIHGPNQLSCIGEIYPGCGTENLLIPGISKAWGCRHTPNPVLRISPNINQPPPQTITIKHKATMGSGNVGMSFRC